MVQKEKNMEVLIGGMSIMDCHLSPEQLTKYILYSEWLIYATWRIVDNILSLLQSVGASEKVFHLMDLLPSNRFLSEGVKMQKLLGHVQFVNVSFQYPSRAPALNHICFSVQANEVVAIVGLSGSGKSTLIYIDGIPLREWDIRWLREHIGFVGQEPKLFHMDIKSNIGYGCKRDIKHEDIEWAANGGQRQRIAIARAILRDPTILILDEPTSALDPESEHQVERVIHGFRDNKNAKRTIIVITHRLSTIKAVDRIVVMDGGQIAGVGDHDELLLRGGLYAQLIRVQSESLA